MRPVPVPESVRTAEWVDGTSVFAAPDGDLTSDRIPPAEGIFYTSKMSGYGDRDFPMVGVLLRLDDEDLERIRNGARHLLMSWHGRQMPVFVVPELLEVTDG